MDLARISGGNRGGFLRNKIWLIILFSAVAYPAYLYWEISSRPKFYEGYFQETPDVHVGDVGFDVQFCLRVKATTAEIETFVANLFESKQRISEEVGDFGRACPADFWLYSFSNKTIAFEHFLDKRSFQYGSRGVLVEGGYMYYWDNSI